MPRLSPDIVIRMFEQAKSIRVPHENDWRKAAAYCMPAHYASWQTDGPTTFQSKNEAARRVNFDTTGSRSLSKYVAVCERMSVPIGQKWHGLTPTDASLQKRHSVRKYFEELQTLLFKYRYHPRARFRVSTNEMFMSMGVYGNGPIYLGERKPSPINREYGFKYQSCTFRNVFVLIDDEGNIVAVFRRFWLNVRQFKIKFKDAPMPTSMASEAAKPTPDETATFEFVHYTAVRDEEDYDPQAISPSRHPVSSSYVCVKDKEYVGEEGGYRSFPYLMPRTATVSGDPYGYSPAVMSLAALGGASAMKKTNLKQGNKAADPPLFAHDDSQVNGEVDQRPGAINYGGVNQQGRLLIQPMPTGNFRVAEALLQDERADIEDSFFVTLFQILTDTPEMTATEVMERVAEKAALLSPTMGRLQSEFLGPMIEREIDLLDELGVLPEMPPELVEAQGEYEVTYTSPLAKSMYAEEVSGFMRAVEVALNVAQATQDTSQLDHFDFDTAIPEMSNHMSVPARWMKPLRDVEAVREDRQTQAQNEQLLQAAPALASAASTAAQIGTE